MADAKIVNIKGVQWDLKDEVARNEILNLQNKDKEITDKIDSVEKTTFSNLLGRNVNITANHKWVKISGLYSGIYYNNNVFIITSRRGEIIHLICPIEDNGSISNPIAISIWRGIYKTEAIRFKDGDVYIYTAGWNSLRVNQISGDPVKISIKNEIPPNDVIEIKINEVQFKEQSTN